MLPCLGLLSAAGVAASGAPLLLAGLKPNTGPVDGGTRVQLQVEGLSKDSASDFAVSLQAVQRTANGAWHQGSQQVSVELKAGEGSDADEFFFTTPNCSKAFGSRSRALLVTLGRAAGDGVTDFVAGPLIFSLTEPLLYLSPAWVSPCCSFQLSGGESIVLAWRLPQPPSHAILLRFRGESGHEQEVEGELLLGTEAAEASGGRVSWCVRCYTPAWPRAEGNVELQASWNSQQFSRLESILSFEEEKSLFGDVVEGITEDHLAQGLEAQPLAAPEVAAAEHGSKVDFEDEDFVLVPDKEEGAPPPGHGPDLEHAVLLDREGDTFVLSRAKDLSHLQEDLRLIHDLFLLTFAATVGGAAASWAKAPSIIGYIVGGAFVGPGMLNCVQELVQVESVAQLGVCMLLFCLGLELSWDELLANTRAAIAGILGMVMVCGAIVLFALFFTETPIREALCIGFFTSLASTPVSLQGIQEFSADGSPRSPSEARAEENSTILAVLVAQDVALALLLAGLPRLLKAERTRGGSGPGAAKHSQLQEEIFHREVNMLVVSAMVFIVLLAAGRRRSWRERALLLLERLRQWLLGLDNESFTLCVLSFAFMLARGSDHFGLSLELGAFLGGLALTRLSEEVALRTLRKLESLKETFLAWFFASVGLVVNPRFLLDNLGAVLSVVAFTFILKLVCGFLPLWALAPRSVLEPAHSSLRAAWVLAHVSEFGFVLAAKGAAWGALSRHAYLLLLGANAVSLCLAPSQFWLRELLLPSLRLRHSSSRKLAI